MVSFTSSSLLKPPAHKNSFSVGKKLKSLGTKVCNVALCAQQTLCAKGLYFLNDLRIHVQRSYVNIQERVLLFIISNERNGFREVVSTRIFRMAMLSLWITCKEFI
jgi:hypothetical protein